jgi:hypothetical protein
MFKVYFVSDVTGCTLEFTGSMEECVNYCENNMDGLTSEEGYDIVDENGKTIKDF